MGQTAPGGDTLRCSWRQCWSYGPATASGASQQAHVHGVGQINIVVEGTTGDGGISGAGRGHLRL